MGNENDPWDDSALINAFQDAITKYKVMHKKENINNSTEVEKGTSNVTETGSSIIGGIYKISRSVVDLEGNINISPNSENDHADGNGEATSHVDTVDHISIAFTSLTDVKEANDLPPIQENRHAESSVVQSKTDSSNSSQPQEALDDYTNSQGTLEYTELLNKYYELEDQRQKVLQQLQQVGSWNYPCSGEGSNYASQVHHDPNYQACHPAFNSSCCPYACNCLAGSWPSMPVCPLAGASTKGPEKLSSLENESIVKTAMGAAEKVISSMKTMAPSTSNIYEGKGKEESGLSGFPKGEMVQTISSETDFTEVLNAWYSAGFFTGKYLSEQSIAKGRHR